MVFEVGLPPTAKRGVNITLYDFILVLLYLNTVAVHSKLGIL